MPAMPRAVWRERSGDAQAVGPTECNHGVRYGVEPVRACETVRCGLTSTVDTAPVTSRSGVRTTVTPGGWTVTTTTTGTTRHQSSRWGYSELFACQCSWHCLRTCRFWQDLKDIAKYAGPFQWNDPGITAPLHTRIRCAYLFVGIRRLHHDGWCGL